MAHHGDQDASRRATPRQGADQDEPGVYGNEALPHGDDIEAFGAPHDYGYRPTGEDLRAPDYVRTGAVEEGSERPAPIEKASGGQFNADLAAERAPGDLQPGEDLKARQDQLLDEAVEETFPASDPISPKRIA